MKPKIIIKKNNEQDTELKPVFKKKVVIKKKIIIKNEDNGIMANNIYKI